MKAPFAGLANVASSAWNRVKDAVSGPTTAGASAILEKLAGRVAVPAMLTGTLALTPVLAQEVPQTGVPPLSTGPAVSAARSAASPESTRLLAQTRRALTPGAARVSGEPATEQVRSILEAVLRKLDALAERPIDVSVTTLLDGREVAQSVYRDIRERKIKNYETL